MINKTLSESLPTQKESVVDLAAYRRIVLLTEGNTNLQSAKTATGLLRFRQSDVIALLDSQSAGSTTGELLGHGGDTPIVGSLAEIDSPDALFIGVSPAGGKLPKAMIGAIRNAVQSGIDVVSGLHEFLSDDPELTSLATDTGSRLIDVRRNTYRETGKHATFREGCIRVHTVGHDCSVGKMFTSLEVERELLRRGLDAKFLATGQTGIMIAGNGIPIDCVVSDFVNGAAENLVLENDHHNFLLVEGQGSIVHPSFSAVTLGLLHGCAPDGLILCYEAKRTATKGLNHVPLRSLAELKTLYETIASFRHPCKVIGIALNGRRISEEEAAIEKKAIGQEFNLPVCDVFRDGPEVLADAVLKLQKELAE